VTLDLTHVKRSPSFCRVCPNSCGILVDVEDGRVVRVTGDRENPLFRGYTCVKGRAIPEEMQRPDRLLHSQKRQPDGSFRPIPVEQAMDEIAERLAAIVDEHGPRALAGYIGTYVIASSTSRPVFTAFLNAMGTPMVFTSNTIDQPGKAIAQALHGEWLAPAQGFSDPDVVLLLGVNPLVTYSGFPTGDPRTFLERVADGRTRLVVVDPRRTDVARRAHLHLQARPGQDAAILAGLLRVILAEDRYDAPFVAEHVHGIAELRAAVEPFTPEVVARRADIDADDLVLAARWFGDARRGYAAAGTGPNMSGPGTLVEYLILCLDTICGHHLRAGERVDNPGTLIPTFSARAQARAPWPAYGYGERLRVRGLADSAAGLSTAALADEILLDGPGRVRALFNCGGNPVAAWPDQQRTIEAMRRLDLLVQVDVRMSGTARMADYIIAPTVALEVPSSTQVADRYALYATGFGFAEAYGQYTPAIVEPPPGSDVIQEWELFYGLAQRMGLELDLPDPRAFGSSAGTGRLRLDMRVRPSTDDLIELLTAGSRIPLDEVRRHPHGACFPEPAVFVEPAEPGASDRLDVANAEMLRDLRAVAGEPLPGPTAPDAFRLVSRRIAAVLNSSLQASSTMRGRTHNPAFLHPLDLERLGLRAGDPVEIRSSRATIVAYVEPDDSVRRGVLSMTHCFGDTDEPAADPSVVGASTGRLVDNDECWDRYSGQPRMSNIPVTVTALAGRAPLPGRTPVEQREQPVPGTPPPEEHA
jgi:anaerobic selenocysteine-containing dehydrogenase